MSSIKTHRVCRSCFEETQDTLNPIRNLEQRVSKMCPTCKNSWDCISVAYSQQDKKWYQIRERTLRSKTNICQAVQGKKKCPKGQSCTHAHNHLEKEIWDSEKGKRVPNKPKFYCYVCKLNFEGRGELETHMQSVDHRRKTDKMRLLPNIGSIGPIRERPNLSIHTLEHQLCPDVCRGKRCLAQNACSFAHSEEECTAWNEALKVELQIGEDVSPSETGGWGDEGDSRREASYKIHKRPEIAVPPSIPSKKKQRNRRGMTQTPDLPSPSGNAFTRPENNFIPEFMKGIRRVISQNGVGTYLSKHPLHINVECNSDVDIVIESQSKEEIKWVFKFTSCQEEQIHAIILHNHRKRFRLGQMTLVELYGHRKQLQKKLYDNHTGCLLDLNIEKDACLEVPVLFSPHVGTYKVYLVFQLLMSELVAYRINVKVRDESFNVPTKIFEDWIDKEMKSIPNIPPHRSVIWEHHYKMMPFPFTAADTKYSTLKGHEIPAKMETMIASGVYSKLGQELCPESYKKRFHDLLFLEEFDHKKRLLKYDLNDYPVNTETAKKELIYSDWQGTNVKKAQGNFRFITFKLNYSLFEGYRSYKPPSQAYVIPNGSDMGFECCYVGKGEDDMHFKITESTVEECEEKGGLAQVRFSPDRNDYVRMHEALCKLDLSVVFPSLKKTKISKNWEEKSILEKSVNEKLSVSQREGLISIIDTKFQTFPTILCGPFGCGKTRTLAIAAKLIALNFHGSTILIVTKNNSCANIYIEELSQSKQFDNILSYKIKLSSRPADIRPILFRHFAKTSLLSQNRNIREYTKYKNDSNPVYDSLTSEELSICSIVVTTTQGCYSLIQLKEKLGKPDLFSHVFIDEAAQITEPEACIPLHFAHASTKVVLAGDVHQTKPLVLSQLALTHNLDRTLLERFYDLREYDSDLLGGCKIELRENFRSQEPIVKFLSKLFYNDCLTANPPIVKGPGKFPCMSMVHVNGEEEKKGFNKFHSFTNRAEGEQTIRALKRFVRAGVDPDNIVVLSTYRGHLKLTEAYLVNERLVNDKNKCAHQRDDTFALCKKYRCVNDVNIRCDRLGKIQGLEYDVLIINTVRTIHDTPSESTFESHLDLGLLDDISQFNTVLSRAKGWVMVIGDTECLTSVGRCSEMWRQYIEACKEQGGFFPDGNISDSEHDALFQGCRTQWTDVVNEQRGRSRVIHRDVEPSMIPMTNNSRGNRADVGPSLNSRDRCYKANERIYKKKTVLEGFISTCNEEIDDPGSNLTVITAVSEQILLANSALEQIEKQSKEIQLSLYTNTNNPSKLSQPSTPPNTYKSTNQGNNRYQQEETAIFSNGMARASVPIPSHHNSASQFRFQSFNRNIPPNRYRPPIYAPQPVYLPRDPNPRFRHITTNITGAYPQPFDGNTNPW